MKKFFCTLIAAVACAAISFAAETKQTVPEKYQAGIFINRINSFDVKTGIAELDLWYWCISDKKEVSLQTLELSNGKLEPVGEIIRQKRENKYYVSRRYIATINCLINTAKFPFDRQQIKLSFEDGEKTSDLMIFSPDVRNSGIDPTFSMNEWHIANISYVVGTHNYPTSFGYLDIPTGQGSEYSQLSVVVELNRRGTVFQKLFKYFWAVFISVVVGLFSLLIRVCDLDGRFGMAVGSLFANVGCSFILSDQLPQSPVMSLAETISYVSLGFIMLFLIESIISLAFYNKGHEKVSKYLDQGTFLTSIIGYGLIWAIVL